MLAFADPMVFYVSGTVAAAAVIDLPVYFALC